MQHQPSPTTTNHTNHVHAKQKSRLLLPALRLGVLMLIIIVKAKPVLPFSPSMPFRSAISTNRRMKIPSPSASSSWARLRIIIISETNPSNPTYSTNNSDQNQNNPIMIRHLKVAFVTGNSMKSREVNAILADHAAESSANTPSSGSHSSSSSTTTTTSIDDTTAAKSEDDHDDDDHASFQYVVDLRVVQVDLPEIQEVDTLAIAKHKAQLASQLVGGGPCVIEDTALQFTALGGMPGPYIKWFQESLQCEGLYKILQGYEDKSATAVCTLAFCPSPHADPILFTGEIRGTIVAPVPGRGFGWDGIFVPEGEDLPFSCMTTEQKNAKSHRGKAVRQWAEWMQRNRRELWQRQEHGSKHRPMIGHKGMDFTIYSPEQ